MSETSNQRPRRVLDAPGDAFHVVDPPITVTRYPLTYWPQSTSDVNHARLPACEDMRDMELAYREQLVDKSGAFRHAMRFATPGVFITPFLVVFVLLAAPLVPFKGTLGLAAAFGLWKLYVHVRDREEFGLQTLVSTMLYPVAILAAVSFVAWLNDYRDFSAPLFALLAFYFFRRNAEKPIRFYESWLYTSPALKPETRRKQKQIEAGPDFGFLAIVLGVGTIGRTPLSAMVALGGLYLTSKMLKARHRLAWVPAAIVVVGSAATAVGVFRWWPNYSPTTAMAIIVCLSLFRLRKLRFGQRLLAPASAIVSQYVSYGLNSSFAPGVWMPDRPRHFRGTLIYWTMLQVSIPLCLGLCYFMPTDVLLSTLHRAVGESIVANDATRRLVILVLPDVELGQIPPPLRERPPYKPPKRTQGIPSPGEVAPGGVEEQFQAQVSQYDAMYQDAVTVWEEESREHARQLSETLGADIAADPQFWAVICFLAALQGDLGYLWIFPLTFFLGMLIPFLVVLSVYRDPILQLEGLQRTVEGHYDRGTWIPGEDQDERTEWQCYVDRLRLSSQSARSKEGYRVREAEHCFLGVEPYKKFPVLLDRKILAEHAYFVGDSGSGKTALGIMPLLIQLIRGHCLLDGTISEPPPIVILDLKGDPALFHTVRAEVEQRRKELGITDPRDPRFAFRFFTPEAQATHSFNPLSSLEDSTSSFSQIGHLLIDSLGLSHGEGYGRSYYSRRNRELLQRALRMAPNSFEELKKLVGDVARHDRDLRVDCYELIATLEALTEYEQISKHVSHADKADAIHMPSVLEHSQVVYFWLPAALESISVREIGKLALYCFLSAAIERQTKRQPVKQSYLVIDEFQRIAGENFKIILEQARSFGIGAILANQSQADLQTADADLRAAVRANTRFKQFFSVTDTAEIDALVKLSGEEIGVMRSHSMTSMSSTVYESVDAAGEKRLLTRGPELEGDPHRTAPESVSFSYSESIKSRFNLNDVLRISDGPLDSIIHISRGSGYSQFAGLPIPLRSNYPISHEEYEYRRTKAPWPDEPAYEIMKPSTSHEDIDAKRKSLIDELHAEMDDEIRGLFDEQQKSDGA